MRETPREKRLGIIMHGVTGRMGMNQHLIRSILEIRKQGGVALKDGTRIIPDPLLVGRNAAKVEELARRHGVQRWTTDMEKAFQSEDQIFFDAASGIRGTTSRQSPRNTRPRPSSVMKSGLSSSARAAAPPFVVCASSRMARA